MSSFNPTHARVGDGEPVRLIETRRRYVALRHPSFPVPIEMAREDFERDYRPIGGCEEPSGATCEVCRCDLSAADPFDGLCAICDSDNELQMRMDADRGGS